MTPRERDPMVWAAAYGAAFDREFASVYRTLEGDRMTHTRAFMSRPDVVRTIVTIADAAVMALHPDGTYTAPDGTVLREPVDEGPRSYPGV